MENEKRKQRVKSGLTILIAFIVGFVLIITILVAIGLFGDVFER